MAPRLRAPTSAQQARAAAARAHKRRRAGATSAPRMRCLSAYAYAARISTRSDKRRAACCALSLLRLLTCENALCAARIARALRRHVPRINII